MKKILIILSLFTLLPSVVYSKILILENCKITKPVMKDNQRDREIKIDLKNSKLTFKGYATYTNPLHIKDELMINQSDILFEAFESKLVKFKLKSEPPKKKTLYIADFEKNILQARVTFYLNSGPESELVVYTCAKSNFDETIPSNKSKKDSKSLLKKLLRK